MMINYPIHNNSIGGAGTNRVVAGKEYLTKPRGSFNDNDKTMPNEEKQLLKKFHDDFKGFKSIYIAYQPQGHNNSLTSKPHATIRKTEA
jgi:hypothetical protein